MINITIWYEYVQEEGTWKENLLGSLPLTKEEKNQFDDFLKTSAEKIRTVYPKGISGTLAAYLGNNPDFNIVETNIYDPEYGLAEEVLDRTDVLIFWAHIAHDAIPDEIADRIVKHVQSGMGFIPLHSAHKSKPFMHLLGTSGCLGWREDDFCRVWNINPAHPIAAGIPEYFELPEEEMYSEPFDIPKPDDIILISWFRGGEVFRSGVTWTRGYGKIFYFQCGHETSPSYHNPHVLRIIENAVLWCVPHIRRLGFDCPNMLTSPESIVKQ